MVARRYVPGRGDLVWLNFAPVRGHEQDGRRPACVISPRAYNAKAGLALVCPLTSKTKGYPFEVAVEAKGIRGVILADQIRSVDWRMRNAVRIGSASETAIAFIQEYLQKLIAE